MGGVFRIVDADGNVTFSDRPAGPAGAKVQANHGGSVAKWAESTLKDLMKRDGYYADVLGAKVTTLAQPPRRRVLAADDDEPQRLLSQGKYIELKRYLGDAESASPKGKP